MNYWPAGLLVIILLTACVNDPETVAELERSLDETVEVAEDVRVIFSDSGYVRGVITAPLMHLYQGSSDQRQEFPAGLRAYFLDQFADTTSTLDANWGVYYRRDKTVTVRDSVVWQSADRQRLETEELNWEEKTERIRTNKFVVLTQPDYIITGYGLESDQAFANAKVLQVTGRVPVSKPRERTEENP